MPEHPILDHLSRPGVRVALAAGLVVLGLGLGGLALSGRGSADAASGASRGGGLSIAVVAPPERDVLPGEVMEVGQLTNEFDGSLPAQRRADAPYDYGVQQPAYVEADWDRDPPRVRRDDEPRYVDRRDDYARNDDPRREARRDDNARIGWVRVDRRAERPSDPAAYATPERDDRARRDAYADDPRTFGFDSPRPDYRAEREARRAAMDARMADARMAEARYREDREVRRYRSSEPAYGPAPYDGRN